MSAGSHRFLGLSAWSVDISVGFPDPFFARSMKIEAPIRVPYFSCGVFAPTHFGMFLIICTFSSSGDVSVCTCSSPYCFCVELLFVSPFFAFLIGAFRMRVSILGIFCGFLCRGVSFSGPPPGCSLYLFGCCFGAGVSMRESRSISLRLLLIPPSVVRLMFHRALVMICCPVVMFGVLIVFLNYAVCWITCQVIGTVPISCTSATFVASCACSHLFLLQAC